MSEPWFVRAKQRLKELGLTQDDLRKPLGVKTRGAVGHYLTGRREPDASQLRALAKALKWSMDELLGENVSWSISEPTSSYIADESLLAKCLVLVDQLIGDMRFPARHPIRTGKHRAELTAHAYRRAVDLGGKITPELQSELRDKIRLAARMLVTP